MMLTVPLNFWCLKNYSGKYSLYFINLQTCFQTLKFITELLECIINVSLMNRISFVFNIFTVPVSIYKISFNGEIC